MKQFTINNKKIEFDSSKVYLDFYRKDGKDVLEEVLFEKLLKQLKEGKIPIDQEFKKYLKYLQRWVIEAPRKRFKRNMRKEGYTVITSDQLFEEDGGEEIINKLENTGIFVDYLLKEIFDDRG